MTLTEVDQRELQELLTRRNMQIRYQHDQLKRERDEHIRVLKAEVEAATAARAARYIASLEQDLRGTSEVLSQVESSLSFRIGRALTWPLRVLRPNS